MVGGDGGTKGDKVGVLSRLQYFTTPYNRDITGGGELVGYLEGSIVVISIKHFACLTNFWHEWSAILDFAGGEVLQTVSKCPLCR